ncbi:hypothetical protein H310_11740 [Aphanomyces invadans]|uniref:Beta-lactamase n=1 Tax=Aphanomyces invadans TaxID=157072 RepID=A0A024TKW4_9STRA|nr:hypothetical protein H310_11740 [Aphanomyces invadans]ETV94785.1 hypothetical protein H310_11740 [Aphanomyces invadans]|eukprot:XP_008876730.1 hypothetical protein H310_11740 [Aphanomyces invadans]
MSDKSADETKRLNEDLEKRLYEFVSNCDEGKGDPGACHSLGEWLAVVDKKYDDAAVVYKKNCDTKNYAASCFNYGRLLLAGKGVEMDDAMAKAALEKACNGGHIHGCHHLGLMYLNAMGGDLDVPKGIAALDKACEAGEGGSCFRLGSMYLTKQSKYSLRRDVVKAKAYLEASCDANYAPACHNLAVLYKNGDDRVAKDSELFKKFSAKTKTLSEQNTVAGGMKAA